MTATPADDNDLRRLLEIEADDVCTADALAVRLRDTPATRSRRPARRGVLAIAAAAVAAAVLIVQAAHDTQPTAASQSNYSFDGAQIAPALIPDADRKYAENVTGSLLSGKGEYDLDRDAGGKVTVVNFWGAWCGPCQVETPQFQAVYDQFRSKGVAFVGIDIKEASRGLPRDFVKRNKITYPIVYDDQGRTAVTLGNIPAQGAPYTVLLDTQHRVAAVYLQRVAPQELTAALTALTTR